MTWHSYRLSPFQVKLLAQISLYENKYVYDKGAGQDVVVYVLGEVMLHTSSIRYGKSLLTLKRTMLPLMIRYVRRLKRA